VSKADSIKNKMRSGTRARQSLMGNPEDTNINVGVKENVKEDIKENVKEDIKANVKEDVQVNPSVNENTSMNTDISVNDNVNVSDNYDEWDSNQNNKELVGLYLDPEVKKALQRLNKKKKRGFQSHFANQELRKALIREGWL
jgi:hypothetical protein